MRVLRVAAPEAKSSERQLRSISPPACSLRYRFLLFLSRKLFQRMFGENAAAGKLRALLDQIEDRVLSLAAAGGQVSQVDLTGRGLNTYEGPGTNARPSGRRKLFDIRLRETSELFAIWKITPDGQVRRTVLSRDRRDLGSLVSAGESSATPSRVSQKSTQKCQHEENRSATNARECNGYDHRRCYFP